MDSEKAGSVANSTTGLGDLLLQHSEIGDWCDVVDKQIDEVGYEVSESKKTSAPAPQRPPPTLYFTSPFYAFISNVNFNAARSDIFYFFGGHDKVLNVHMYSYASQNFNGNCLIELKNFNSLIETLKLDEEKILGRPIGVEHCIMPDKRRRKYTLQELENAREDTRRKDNNRSFNRMPVDSQRDGRRHPQTHRSSMHSNFGGNASQLLNSSQPLRVGGGMVSNDVRASQMHQSHNNNTQAATHFQRGGGQRLRGQQHYQKSSHGSHPRHQQQHGPAPLRNIKLEEKPLAVEQQPQPKQISKPAHVDIYGRGKPADTSNKLLEIQKKLDNEQRMTEPVVQQQELVVEVLPPPPPPSHSGGRHSTRQPFITEPSHHKPFRPSVSKSGLEAIKKLVVSSNSAESVSRNADKSGGGTSTDSGTSNANMGPASGVNGRARKSFSRDSQKSGGGSRRNTTGRGIPAKIYVNSNTSKKSLSHQSSTHSNLASIEHNYPSERKQSNHYIPTTKMEQNDISDESVGFNHQQQRFTLQRSNRSDPTGDSISDLHGRKLSTGGARPPRPGKMDEMKSNSSSGRNSKKRIENKTSVETNLPPVTLNKSNLSIAKVDQDFFKKDENANIQTTQQSGHKSARASSAGEAVGEKQMRKSSVDNSRPTLVSTPVEAKVAGKTTKKSKKPRRLESTLRISKQNRYEALADAEC